jgi:hypothetical protein
MDVAAGRICSFMVIASEVRVHITGVAITFSIVLFTPTFVNIFHHIYVMNAVVKQKLITP